ncbi:MAG: type II CAAX endopeptidase family protein [Cyanobacteria bacterium J06632_3]
MTPKRIILSVLTLLVAWVMGASLISSFGEPQVGNQLQLYQTDLLVQASEWQGSGLPEAEVQQFRRAVFGEDALESATEQYQEVRKDAVTGLARIQQQIDNSSELAAERRQALMTTAQSQQQLINQIDLRLGMVQERQGDVPAALDTWTALADRPGDSAIAAKTLADLWKTPPVVTPDTAVVINQKLNGWYRYVALERLYNLEDETQQLEQLTTNEVDAAERTIIQLSLVGVLPSLGALIGTALLIALIAQRLLRGKESILAISDGQWQVPWDWEVVWLVIVGGFLFVGQLALPFVLQVGLLLAQSVGSPSTPLPAMVMNMAELLQSGSQSFAESGPASTGLASTGLVLGLASRGKALYSLVFYLLMAASTLTVLYVSIKDYLPLSKEWFRFDFSGKWPLWGFGGYLVALPLMLVVSLLNQQIWQGQGGNNPILQLVLQERDSVALAMFLFTAAVAAPVFEEILFRGFLLPSLTRYMPAWGAIGLSSLIFSVAHLSFSEVIPLSVLGAILGFAYVRSQNLMSSILLHSTWNSVTMIGLFLLGSGAA